MILTCISTSLCSMHPLWFPQMNLLPWYLSLCLPFISFSITFPIRQFCFNICLSQLTFLSLNIILIIFFCTYLFQCCLISSYICSSFFCFILQVHIRKLSRYVCLPTSKSQLCRVLYSDIAFQSFFFLNESLSLPVIDFFLLHEAICTIVTKTFIYFVLSIH